MSIRVRLFLAFVILVGAGFYFLVDWIVGDLRPRYSATMEESTVDMANILASWVETQVEDGGIQTDGLRAALDVAQKRTFCARIYEMTKTSINVRVYVVDCDGLVVFDSDEGKDEGKDYSRWLDVTRALSGGYGARATRSDPEDPRTSVHYVAAPIYHDGEIIGALSVGKPARSTVLFLNTARVKIVLGGMVATVAVALLGLVVTFWIVWPIGQLTRYANAVRDGKRARLPRLGRGEVASLGVAFEEMRAALEGKQYVENYVQTLTHQMKSPLSAIRGAAELLQEDVPPEQRGRFLENIRSESARIQELIDRMLQLSALENRRHLRDTEEVDLAALLNGIVAAMEPVASAKGIRVSLAMEGPAIIRGERFLVRQALSNLLQNAVDFSDEKGEVAVTLRCTDTTAKVTVLDNGPGIPEYALDKVFDRFYSLGRPGTGKKSTGLGLPFAREVAELHGGFAMVENRPEGGAKATLTLATRPPQGQE